MKLNKWTLGLAAAGIVTCPSLLLAADQQQQPNSVLTALSSTTLSGYVDVSAQWNPGTGNANPVPVTFNRNKQDGFNLNVVQLSLSKPLDESEWAAGYNMDLWFGPDAKTLGTSSYLGLANAASDFAIRQAYVSLRTPVGNGLDWKIGVFDTVVGYESLSSPNNPHYTHSYGFTLEPTTHTGVLTSYRVNEEVSFSLGVANTVGPSINERAFGTPIPLALYGSPSIALPVGGNKAESYKTYMGSLAVTAPDSMGWLAGSTAYAGIVNGFNSARYGNQGNYYAGLTMATPVTGLKAGASFDYLASPKNAYDWVTSLTTGIPTYVSIPDAWALGLYGSFQATEKMTFLVRGEHLSANHDAGNIYALTATVQYDLWKNVLSRLEFRWDHAEHGMMFGGTPVNISTLATAPNPLGADPDRANAFMFAANVIYKF